MFLPNMFKTQELGETPGDILEVGPGEDARGFGKNCVKTMGSAEKIACRRILPPVVKNSANKAQTIFWCFFLDFRRSGNSHDPAIIHHNLFCNIITIIVF